jgi:hypothetical protein
MKILFYLPVVTPWWFSELIAPMIRALHDEAEVHVMIASLWRNTGIEAENLAPLSDLERIHWHVIDPDHGEAFRFDGASVPGLLDLVAQIAPDLTLARSADTHTPARFPGPLRYIMEGALPPFDIAPPPILIEETPFALGAMPAGSDAIADHCVGALADLWAASDRFRYPELRSNWRRSLGLPTERPILAVPLHYEHEENLFLMHSRFPKAVDLITHLLATLDEDVFLAVSDHPLNRRHVDRREVDLLLQDNGDRAALCQLDRNPGATSGILAAHADAVLIEMSKSWGMAAHVGTPMIHIDGANPANWLRATALSNPMLRDWSKARLERPDPVATHRYFCWHLGTRTIDPHALTLDRLMQHVSGQVSDSIIDANARNLRNRWLEAA